MNAKEFAIDLVRQDWEDGWKEDLDDSKEYILYRLSCDPEFVEQVFQSISKNERQEFVESVIYFVKLISEGDLS